MSLRNEVVSTALSTADAATAAAKAATRKSAHEIGERIAMWFDHEVDVKWVRSHTVDRPHEAGDRYSKRVVFDDVMVHEYLLDDDIEVGATGSLQNGVHLFVKTVCSDCGQPTYTSGFQTYAHLPWGHGIDEPYGVKDPSPQTHTYYLENSLPKLKLELGRALQVKALCAGCLLRIPEHCPSCDRRLRY